MKKLGILCASLFLAAGLSAQGTFVTHLWVDGVNGSDTNPGTKAKPFKTLTKGLTTLKSNVVVHVLPAVYGPQTTGDFYDPATKKSKHVDLLNCKNFKVVGTDRDKCIIDFNNLGNQFWSFIWVRGSATDGVEVTNLTFRNTGTKSWGTGPVHTHGGCGKNVDIHGNVYIDCNSAFIAWAGTNVAFHDNVVISTKKGTGVAVRIRIGKATESCYIYNNVFYQQGHGISWSNSSKAPKQWICNNIVLNGSTGFPGSKPNATFVTMKNNISFGNTTNYAYTPDPSNLTVDPKLVNPAKYDFRQQTGSPCLDGGYPMGLAHMANDFYGNARVADGDLNGVSVPDIGVHEVVQATLSVSNFAQGQTATFQTQKLVNAGFAGVIFLASGKDTFVASPFGIFSLDITKLAVYGLITFPGQYKLPIPTSTALNGLVLYSQALGFRPQTGGGFVFMPTGRLDLYL